MYKLWDLFNSLSAFALPSAWKCAIVMPPHKAGAHHDFNNYCPPKICYQVIYSSLCRSVCCPYQTHQCAMYRTLNCLPLSAQRHYHWFQCIFKCIKFISNNIQHYTYPHTLANKLRILTFLFLKLTKKLAVMLFNSKHLLTRTICDRGLLQDLYIFLVETLKRWTNPINRVWKNKQFRCYVQDAMYCIADISTAK